MEQKITGKAEKVIFALIHIPHFLINVSFEFSRQNCLFQLSSYAEEWAQKLAREDTFEHRTNQELGENLYCSWSSNPKAKCPGDKPVDSWYSEIKKYNFGAEPTNLSSGESSSID